MKRILNRYTTPESYKHNKYINLTDTIKEIIKTDLDLSRYAFFPNGSISCSDTYNGAVLVATELYLHKLGMSSLNFINDEVRDKVYEALKNMDYIYSNYYSCSHGSRFTHLTNASNLICILYYNHMLFSDTVIEVLRSHKDMLISGDWTRAEYQNNLCIDLTGSEDSIMRYMYKYMNATIEDLILYTIIMFDLENILCIGGKYYYAFSKNFSYNNSITIEYDDLLALAHPTPVVESKVHGEDIPKRVIRKKEVKARVITKTKSEMNNENN